MEEMVGRWWHNAITRLAQRNYPQAAVGLEEMQKAIGIMFRAAGGSAALRISTATDQNVSGYRNLLQRVAGTGTRADTTQLEPDVLALPHTLAVFAEHTLNRDLYLWLAIQSACFSPTGHWLNDNYHATQRALAAFPGFVPRYQRLLQAHLTQRGSPTLLSGKIARMEAALQATLRGECPSDDVDPTQLAPVWLWISASAAATALAERKTSTAPQADTARTNNAEDKKRRRTQRMQDGDKSNSPFILPFRAEALLSWSEMVRVNRSTDDEDDGNAINAANDMNKLTIAPDGQTLASRVKFDLDLPSSSADDLPMGPGITLPEWDYHRARMQPDHCAIQVMAVRDAQPFTPPSALRLTAKHLRRRLEVLRDIPRPLHGQDSGDAIDLDAWVRYSTDEMGHHGTRSDTPPVYTRQTRTERSLSTLLLADLSLSTDAYATADQRVIDVIRDALFVFGEALSATGDPFAIWGFSSVRRQHVRLQHLKDFDESWNDQARARVGAIRPGYYTRMGAAIRHATLQLSQRPERKRLLMLLTDGKPNDLDNYEGRYGIEDTRHAIHEAHAAGLSPFCVTIDEAGHDYLPYLFGRQGYALVHRPKDLVSRLTQAWATLAR